MHPQKRLALTDASHPASGTPVKGYEIHLGKTDGPDRAHAWLEVGGHPEGAATANGQVRGTYLHGLFASDGFRAAYLSGLGTHSGLKFDDALEVTLDALASHIETHLNVDLLLELSETA
jgi:adenosylcobyric acid synthase